MVEMKEKDLRELKKRGYDLNELNKDLNELDNEEQKIYYPKKKKK